MTLGVGAGERSAAGLTAAEVEDRRRRGLVNVTPAAPSRTFAQILRANVVTPVNVLLGGLLVVVLVVAPIQDATFGLVIVFNSVVGAVQEVRAKRTLERLSILSAPRARVVRDGVAREVDVEEVVLDDLLDLGPGDQVVVDGDVVGAHGLEVDESLLTGESDDLPKRPGDPLLSGSFATVGSGRYRATRVGADAYAARLADEARRFSLVRSELQAGLGRIVKVVTVLMVPAAVLLVTGQLRTGAEWRPAAQRSAAGLIAMVPEGLLLLTSIAFAAGVIRLGQRQCLVKELPAVELLARTTVVCLDKTGTITDGRIVVRHVLAVGGAPLDEVEAGLGAMVGAEEHPNGTLSAIGARCRPPPGWSLAGRVGFSSTRKWSAAAFEGRGAWYLGAPEILLASAAGDQAGDTQLGDVAGRVEAQASQGRRVVLVARAERLTGEALPPDLRPVAVVVLEERVRDDAPATIAYFQAQGVELRVISGDNPATVGAVAERVGVPGADRPVDARGLPEDRAELAEVLATRTVYGRVTPQQKQAMVGALQSRGHVVAMTGDGVNDVLALKDADLGIAMGNGTAATRAVARVVLLDGRFSSLPAVVAEGRRVITNIERVANLFLTKTAYALIFAVVTGALAVTYPFLPRHFTLVSAFAIGIPGFFLALAPARRRARPGFVSRVLGFVVVSGPSLAVAVLAVYARARSAGDATQLESQTAATIVLFGGSLMVLLEVARPLTPWKAVLVAVMAGCGALVLAVPAARDFFALDLPGPETWAAIAVGLGAVAVALVLLGRGGLLLGASRAADAADAEDPRRTHRAGASDAGDTRMEGART